MKYLLVVFSLFILFGCSSKKVKPIVIQDLVTIPQDVTVFTKNMDEEAALYEIQKKYEKYYFRMWNIKEPKESVKDIAWPFESFKAVNTYGENLQPLQQKFFDDMYENANLNAFGTLNKKGITLRHSALRAFPTIRPLLKDPSLAGEGFPFDYLQNSSIEANKPIFISHYSKNKAWVYAFSSFASGWIKTSDIVFLDEKYTDKWQKAEQIFITKDNIPVFSNDGDFLFNAKIGMMFALVSEDSESYTVLTVSNCKVTKPYFLKSKISKSVSHKGVFALDKNNLNKIISGIFDTNYGWGGMYEQRDCSSTIRDLFTPFGIWLPRNSSQQAKVGEVISLKGLSDDEKIKLIKEKGVPFQTLLHKNGHIVLYAGTYNNEVIIFHNTWGIKTTNDGIDGRIIIGKTIFSTLRLGKEQDDYNKDSEILKNIKSMNILTR